MLKLSTTESVSLERKVDLTVEPVETSPKNLTDVYEINKCVDWITSNDFQKVCLQFPDYMLPDSSEVVLRLQARLNQTLYIVGDTAFESCCIDYIAAEHINGDAIIHFGPVCFSRTSANIPYLNIYEKEKLDVQLLRNSFCEVFPGDDEITILVDTPYIHRLDDLVSAFGSHKNVIVQPIDEYPLAVANKVIVFLGKHERKLINIDFSFQPNLLYYFDGALKKYVTDPKLLKRRSYITEKVKDARTIAIVIGTLCVKDYLKIVERLKKLIKLSGKKYYLISVGKPTVSKLSNFQEIDIYVIITCSLSEIYDSRDFYKPIITPFDVELALNANRDPNAKFSYDYNTFLTDDYDLETIKVAERQEGDISLLTNTIRPTMQEESAPETAATELDPAESQVALKSEGTVALSSHFGAGFLAERSWRGLEQNLGQTEVELAQEGRTGIATKYEGEGSIESKK